MSANDLSHRHLEVLQLAAAGCLRWEIGEKLHITEATVRNHLVTIHQRLGARNTTHAVALAIVRGLIIFQES